MTDSLATVAQLILHERQARDRGWWQEMRDCFAPGATVRLSWFRGSARDFVAESEKMASNGHFNRHRLGPPVVHRHDQRAVVEVSAAIEIPTVYDGVEADLLSYARLVYRVEQRSGRWLIVSLDPVYERDTLTPSVPGTSLVVDPAQLAESRRPYRLLAHVLGRQGYSVDQDLYGDDRPEPVAQFYKATFDWLRHARS